MPVVEIVTFPASDTFINDRSVFKSALDILVKLDGSISAYHGLQIEDNKTGYLIVVWETYEHHKKVMEREDYGVLIDALKPALAGSPDVQHIEFDADPIRALDAPVTELAALKLKQNTSESEFLSKFKKIHEQHNKTQTHHATVLGESREHKRSWITAIGWDSVEAHQSRVREEVYTQIIGDVYALADIEIWHISLAKAF